MPLTALYREHAEDPCTTQRRADATQDDQGIGVPWGRVHRPARPAPLTCPMCGGRVIARVSSLGLRHYVHHRRSPDCASGAESVEHLAWKARIADAIRAAGWVAEFEVASTTADGTRVVSDVQAVRTSTPGRPEVRVGWEIQLASLTPDEAASRHASYRERCRAVCWVSPRRRRPSWMERVPSVLVAEHSGAVRVTEGLHDGPRDLESFVDRVLRRAVREFAAAAHGPWAWASSNPWLRRATPNPDRPTRCHERGHGFVGSMSWPPACSPAPSGRVAIAVCGRADCLGEARSWVLAHGVAEPTFTTFASVAAANIASSS